MLIGITQSGYSLQRYSATSGLLPLYTVHEAAIKQFIAERTSFRIKLAPQIALADERPCIF